MRKGGLRYRVSVRQDPRPAPLSGKRLKELSLDALARLPAAEADLRIRVVGDDAIARWNREFLGRDRPTNVLSFPDGEAPPARGGAISGDVLVSAPTCLAQTEDWKETPEERVFYFILHGILHLAGYEHVSGGAEGRRMRRKELLLFRRVLLGERKERLK
ncbi:MAG: rRNA maturation RNase YbeY [Deltaproteobacteria bacterium]|nr:rRNA maturation RNase YbeY [Deltaproteobacteria bacterium]